MTEPTQTLGRYVIYEELGRGGFATVYRAQDTSLNRDVALKILHPQLLTDRAFVERFRKEARTLAGLRHAHIITIYEVSEADGRLFLAMELARGSSLAQAIADRKCIPWSETLALLKSVSDALDYAHGQGVIHRDLKPANILLDSERGPLLTDFGFARLMGDSSVSMSLSGGILGTPAYIAPEVWELDQATDAVDIYALGCIAYEMVTGETLFTGKTPMQTMRAHDRGPQFVVNWPSDAPPGLDQALQVALARKPEARYPAASALWHALNDLEASAQAEREKAERQAVADQWKAEAEAALAEREWSAAKMAVGRWLAITPDDSAALVMRDEITRKMEEAAREQDAHKRQEEVERAAQAALTQEIAPKAKEEAEAKARQEAEEQERRQAAIVAQDQANREAEEKAQHEQEERKQQIAVESVYRPITQPLGPDTIVSPKSATTPWLFMVGTVVIVAIFVALASVGRGGPAAPIAQPTQASVPKVASGEIQMTFYSQTSDNELGNNDCIDWDNCRNNTTGDYLVDNLEQGTVSADLSSNGRYTVRRIFLNFDTSAIPSNAVANSAVLRVHANQWAEGNTTIHVVQSTANIPASSVDFGHIRNISGGSITISPNTWGDIRLETAALNWITKGGVTSLALVHASDLNDSKPRQPNNVTVSLAESSGYRPTLVVNYSLP